MTVLPVPRGLRALIVEDNSADAQQFILELKRMAFDPEWECVAGERAFLAALDRSPEVILANFAHRFDAMRALDLTRSRGLDTPFVIVAGVESAEAAVAAIKHGADDYVVKNRLQRLGPAVVKALEDKRLRDERGHAETDLRMREEHYHALVQSLPVAFYSCDLQGRVTLCNIEAVKLWGWTPRLDSDLWSGSWKTFEPDGRPLPLDESPMAITLREGRPIRDRELVIEDADGNRRSILAYLTPIRNASGDMVGSGNILVDISNRKQTEASLQRSERRFRAIVDHAGVGVTMNDIETGRFITVNQTFCDIVGYTCDELMTKTYRDLTHPDDLIRSTNLREQLNSGRIKSFNIDSRYVRADGIAVWCNMTVSPLWKPDDSARFDTTVSTDITERMNAEGERLQYQLALAHVGRISVAAEMASGMAHELKQPLTSILNFTDACQEGFKAKTVDVMRQLHLTTKIMEQAQRAGEIIQHLQDFVTRSEAKRSEFELPKSIDRVLTFIESYAQLNEVQLTTVIHGAVPLMTGDSILIEQLLLNLIRNAIEAQLNQTDAPKQVQIEVAAKANATVNFIEILVTDNGATIGIDDTEQLFVSFFTTKVNGMGFGLPISRSIAEAHQGTLTAQKRLPRGMQFRVTLGLGRWIE